MSEPYVVKDELWFDVNPKTGKTLARTFTTIRPRRRRSWSEEGLRAAWAYLMAQPDPEKIRLTGSNTRELAGKLGLLARPTPASPEAPAEPVEEN